MIIGNVNGVDYTNSLRKNNIKTQDSMRKISSGKRINGAADDAGGLAISEGFRSQVRGLAQGQRNTQDAVSMLQVVDGALGDITSQMQRMRELAVQAGNGTYTDEDRENLAKEFEEIKKSIQCVVDSSEFNGIKILDSNKSLNVQTNYNVSSQYNFKLYDMNNSTTGIDILSINTQSSSEDSITKIDIAIGMTTKNRANSGIDLNNLKHELSNNSNAEVNSTASLSKIEDIDIATSMMALLKDQVIANYNQSMVSNINQRENLIAHLVTSSGL